MLDDALTETPVPVEGQLTWAIEAFTAFWEGEPVPPALYDAALDTVTEWGLLPLLMPTNEQMDALAGLGPEPPLLEAEAAADGDAGEPLPDMWAWGWFFSYLYGAKIAPDAAGFSEALRAAIEHAQRHDLLPEACRLEMFRDVLGVDPFPPSPALN